MFGHLYLDHPVGRVPTSWMFCMGVTVRRRPEASFLFIPYSKYLSTFLIIVDQ